MLNAGFLIFNINCTKKEGCVKFDTPLNMF